MKNIILDSLNFAYLVGILLLATLKPEEDWIYNSFSQAVAIALSLVVLGAIVSKILEKTGIKTLGVVLFQSQKNLDQKAPVAFWKTFWGFQTTLTFLITLVASFVVTEFSIREILSEKGFQGASRIFVALATPNFEVLPAAISAIFETIFMAFLATSLALPVAFIMGFLCAKNIMGKTPINFAIYTLFRAILNIVRSIEPLIWAIVFSVWVGIGPFAGMLALMIHTIASLTKQYSEMVEAVDEGPIEGILATGANSIQVIWYAIVPQIVLPYLSFTIYRWDINVRMSTIIGLVGGGGIGTLLDQFRGQALWNEVGCLALVIVVTVWSMDLFSAYVREALK